MTRIKRGKFSELKHFYAKNSSLEHWGLFQGPLYFTSSNKVVLEKSMSVKYFVGMSAKKEKKQEKKLLLGTKSSKFVQEYLTL